MNIEEVSIPVCLKTIEEYCFFNCSSLKTLAIPKSSILTTISDYAFYNCVKLSNLILPIFVHTLGLSCFENCWMLSNTLTLSDVLNQNNLDPYGYPKLPKPESFFNNSFYESAL